MAGNDAAGSGILLAPQEALALRLGVLRWVDFEELGADLLAVYRDDFRAVFTRGRLHVSQTSTNQTRLTA
jgi:hypothetical protein